MHPARSQAMIPSSGSQCSITIFPPIKIHVWTVWSGWRAAAMTPRSPTDLASSTKLVCSGMLGLLHALRQTRMEQFARGFQIITQDGVATDESESVSPQISQFWGLGRVVSAEYPGLRCRLIDVDDLQAIDIIAGRSCAVRFARKPDRVTLRSSERSTVDSHKGTAARQRILGRSRCQLPDHRRPGNAGPASRPVVGAARCRPRRAGFATGAHRFDSRHHCRDRADGMPSPCSTCRHQSAR